MRASRHVVRRSEPVVADAVPEILDEPTTNSTMRIDMVNLDPLLAESRDVPDDDAEIVVVAEGSQQLPRVERSRMAHTLPRAGKPAPAPAAAISPARVPAAPVPAPVIAPVLPPSIDELADDARPIDMVVDDSRPIDELAEARIVAAPSSDVSRRRRVGIAIVAIVVACGAAIAAACMV